MIGQVLSNTKGLDDESLFESALDFMQSGEMVYAVYLLKRIQKKDDFISYNLAISLYNLGFWKEAYDELRFIRERTISNFDFNFLPSSLLEKTRLGFPPIGRMCEDSIFTISLIRLKLALCKKLGLDAEFKRLSAYLPEGKPWNSGFLGG